MARRAAVAILAAIAAFSTASRASAYCRTTTDEAFVQTSAQPCDPNGVPLAWSRDAVGYRLNQSASVQVAFEDAMVASKTAFHDWVTVACPADIPACSGTSTDNPSITISYDGPTAVHVAEYKGDGSDENVVLFWDSGWPHTDGDSTLALTTVTFGTSSGEIYDADIEVNSDPAIHALSTADSTPSAAYDLPSIFQHETGHFFGLAHTQPDNTASTMSAHYKTGESFMRTLEPDDVCGICNIYPPGRTTNQTLRGGCHCAFVGGEASGADLVIVPGIGLAGIGLAVIGLARRRRR